MIKSEWGGSVRGFINSHHFTLPPSIKKTLMKKRKVTRNDNPSCKVPRVWQPCAHAALAYCRGLEGAETYDICGDDTHACTESGCRLCAACGREYLSEYFEKSWSMEKVECPGRRAADLGLGIAPEKTREPTKESVYVFFRAFDEAHYHVVVANMAKAQRRSELRRLLFRTITRHVELPCAGCPTVGIFSTRVLNKAPVTTCSVCLVRTCAGCGARVHTAQHVKDHCKHCLAPMAEDFTHLGSARIQRMAEGQDVRGAAELITRLVRRAVAVECGICTTSIHEMSLVAGGDLRMHCMCGTVSCAGCGSVHVSNGAELEQALGVKERMRAYSDRGGGVALPGTNEVVAFCEQRPELVWDAHKCPASDPRGRLAFDSEEVAVLLMGWRGKDYVPHSLWPEFSRLCSLMRTLEQVTSREFLVSCSGLINFDTVLPTKPSGVAGRRNEPCFPDEGYTGTLVDFVLDRATLVHQLKVKLGDEDIGGLLPTDRRLLPFRRLNVR